jgi:hypothetical protein
VGETKQSVNKLNEECLEKKQKSTKQSNPENNLSKYVRREQFHFFAFTMSTKLVNMPLEITLSTMERACGGQYKWQSNPIFIRTS